MSNSVRSTMMFAFTQDARVVHVDEVMNGAKCGCICPSCHAPLIAKNGGDERAHHFAHDGRLEGHSCSETALHFAAKQIIADQKCLLLPAATLLNNTGGDIADFTEVRLEYRLEIDSEENQHIVADCFGISGEKSTIIEIAVHNQVNLDKQKKLQLINIPSIEISLTDLADTVWNWANLKEAVLFDAQRRKWLWQPEPIQVSAVVEDFHIQSATDTNRQEWIFEIGGKLVWVKKLPIVNFKVFHRPNDYLRHIVQPICQNKGYWNPKFNCWVVFDQFREEVLSKLSVFGRIL